MSRLPPLPLGRSRGRRRQGRYVVSQTILKAHASSDQRAQYLEAGLEVQAGLEEAIRLVKVRRSCMSDPDERRRVKTHILKLRAAHAHILADLVGFLSDSFRLRAPEPADLSDIKELSRAIYAMLPGGDSLRDVMLTADRLVAKWAETRPDEDAGLHLRLEAS